MKKFLSVFLAILMLLSVIPLTVSATETAEDKTDKITITINDGTATEYNVNELETVLSGDTVANGSTVVVELLADVTTTGRIYLPDKALTITINGNDHKWTSTIGSYIIENIAYTKSFTVNNTNFESTARGFRMVYGPRVGGTDYQTTHAEDKVTVLFNNCQIVTNANDVFEMRGATNADGDNISYEITLQGTTVTQNAGDYFVFMNANFAGKILVMNIDNSTINHNGTYGVLSNGGTATFNFTGTSTFSSKATSGYMFHTSPGNFNLNLGSETTLALIGGTDYAKNGSGSITITDNGATWTADAAAVQKGVNLPVVTDKQWKIKDTDNWVTSPYTNADAQGSVSFVAATNYADMVKVTVGETSEDINIANLATKLAELDAGSTVTIDLLDNVTVGQVAIPDKNLTIVINGNNKTWTKSTGDFIIAFLARAKSITINNTIFNATTGKAFHWENNATVTNESSEVKFYNCKITSVGRILEMNAAKKADETVMPYTVTFENTEIEHTSGTQTFYTNKNITAPVVINLKDSYVSKKTAGTIDYSTDVMMFTEAADVTINVTGASTLTQTFTTAYDGTQTMFWTGDTSTKFTINLDEGTTVTLNALNNAEATKIACHYVITNKATTAVSINDAGATWTANADALKATKGLTTPAWMKAAEGETLLGFSTGTALYKVGGALKNAEATEGVSFKVVSVSNDDFNMSGKASMRLDNPSGIRFKLNVSKELAALLGDSAIYRVLLSPASYATAENPLTNSTGGIVYAELNKENGELGGWSETDDNYNYLRAAIAVDATSKNAVNYDISARGAVQVTYADNSTEWIYTANTDTADLVTVAELAAADPNNSAYADFLAGIIAKKA